MIVDAISICVISYSETETEGRLQRTLKYSVSLQEEKKKRHSICSCNLISIDETKSTFNHVMYMLSLTILDVHLDRSINRAFKQLVRMSISSIIWSTAY